MSDILNTPTGGASQTVTIDLDAAVRLSIPRGAPDLQPLRFIAPDGRSGWCLRMPGGRPIATPAHEEGRLFVGGGYGSHEFYAFDAIAGELIWKLRTADDGPTAAVVERGLVAFNTESCTVMVVAAATGTVLWEEWLGDPLMGQPAIAGDRLFIVYPANQNRPVLRPEMTLEQKRAAIADAKHHRGGGPHEHRLLCAHLRTGEHIWEQVLSGDAISSPVIDGDQIFVSCLDGTSFCLNIRDGAIVWKQANRGTSAPLVVAGRVIFTEKEALGAEVFQRMRRTERGSGAASDPSAIYRRRADYLRAEKGGGSALKGAQAQHLDQGVGFGTAPSSAKMHAAQGHLGIGTVSAAWAYQGSRPAFAGGRIFSNHGRHVSCVLDTDQTTQWEAEARGQGVDPDDQIFLPPALGREYVYLTSMLGHAVSVHQESGRAGLLYSTGRGITFQPCLANGRMYFGTTEGELICLETGSDDADGWYMWGGNAQHNKTG